MTNWGLRESRSAKGRHLDYAIQFPCEGSTGWLGVCQDLLYYLNGCYILYRGHGNGTLPKLYKCGKQQLIVVFHTCILQRTKIKIPESDIFHMLDYSLKSSSRLAKGLLTWSNIFVGHLVGEGWKNGNTRIYNISF